MCCCLCLKCFKTHTQASLLSKFYGGNTQLPYFCTSPSVTSIWCLCLKCSKTHLQAPLIPKFSQKWYPGPPLKRGRAEGSEGKERSCFMTVGGWTPLSTDTAAIWITRAIISTRALGTMPYCRRVAECLKYTRFKAHTDQMRTDRWKHS